MQSSLHFCRERHLRGSAYLSWGKGGQPRAGSGFPPRRNWPWPQCSRRAGRLQPCPGSQPLFFSNLISKHKRTFKIINRRTVIDNWEWRALYMLCRLTSYMTSLQPTRPRWFRAFSSQVFHKRMDWVWQIKGSASTLPESMRKSIPSREQTRGQCQFNLGNWEQVTE